MPARRDTVREQLLSCKVVKNVMPEARAAFEDEATVVIESERGEL